jgi:primary-amine oxidase
MDGHHHPLDPLGADEIVRAVACLRRERGVEQTWRFAYVELEEPTKAELADDGSLPRRAAAEVWNPATGETFQATIDLAGDTVADWRPIPGVQPRFTSDEYLDCDRMLRAHPDVLAALARHGVDDPAHCLFDVWAYDGSMVPAAHRDRRVGWCDVWRRAAPGANPYAHPIPGMRPIVDMNTLELLEIEEWDDPGMPAVDGEYDPERRPRTALRTDLRPLDVVQPQGPSFTLDGGLLRWQGWELRLGFNAREGLVLHQVGYREADRLRPIAHRMSFAEMVVPYRDPSPAHRLRIAFDIGEWGMGAMTQSLELHCDCVGEIRYVDAVLADTRGRPVTIRNAICLHEEDDGVLWKHVDEVSGAEVRRRRRLVASFHATVANYEYLVYWRFYQDGTIECEVRATGLMVTTPLPAGARSPHGTMVDERTYAPYHQHFIVVRLDMDVDGTANTVQETGTALLPTGPDNPAGLALVVHSAPVRSEREAARDVDWHSQRSWLIENPARRNAHGDPVAYRLVPTGAIPTLLAPDAPLLRRASVIGHPLWVTRFADDERWPAGEHPTQAAQDDGIARWIRQDRPLENEDVVLWYVIGIQHLPRAEDWPVMPTDAVSFRLTPSGFFDRNPALDVAAEAGHCDPGEH